MKPLRDLSLSHKFGIFLLTSIPWIIVIHQYTSEEIVVAVLEMQMPKPVEGIDPVTVTEDAARALQSAFSGTIKSGERLYAEFVRKGVEWKAFCKEDPTCPFELGGYAGAHHVLVSSLEEIAPERFRIAARIYHIRTHRAGRKVQEVAARGEVTEKLAALYADLLDVDRESLSFSPPPPPPAEVVASGGLRIETSPPGAQVTFDGKEMGPTPLTLEGIPAGKHDLSIELDRYFPIHREVSVPAGVVRDLAIELVSALGILEVTSTPPGAEVFLDEEDTGKKTPATIFDLEAREYPIRLRLAHYFDLEDSVFVYPARKSNIHFELRGKPTRFTIEGTPKGAQVYCDKVFQGYAPLTLELAPQVDHPLVVHLPGFQAHLATIRGGIDEERTFAYTLERGGKGPGTGEMVKIPAGSFTMGSSTKDVVIGLELCPTCQAEDFKIEQPQRKVFLKGYRIDRYEVTNAEYEKCVAAGVCKATPFLGKAGFDDPRQPVVGVMYEDAERYCRWVGKRMPTEAEWEKAARGTDKRLFPWGWEIDCTKAHHAQGLGYDCRDALPRHPMPVGSFPEGKSPYGLYDMAGNVWEWVSDYFADDGYARVSTKNPTGPPPNESGWRVLRGGSWTDGAVDLRTTSRVCSCAAPEYLNALGFRCAQDL